jgi:hypothetical protein
LRSFEDQQPIGRVQLQNYFSVDDFDSLPIEALDALLDNPRIG